MTSRLTIALLWHSMNSDNLGVGALTLAHIEILRAAAAKAGISPHFLAMSWQDSRPDYGKWADIEALHFRTRHVPGPSGPLARGLARADLVVDIGGGDSFTDIYGAKRFLTIWATKLHALRRGLPLILAPQTIGPFRTRSARIMARWALRRARLVVSRDAPTTTALHHLGISQVLEATDVAMRLPYNLPAPRDNGAAVKVGLNVSGLLFNGGYTKANQFGLADDHPALIRRIIRFFLAQPRTELHLIGHVQSETIEVEDDHRVNLQLAQEFPDIIVSPVFGSPVAAKSYIAGMDFFVGARMHATIAAFSAGVPVVPMAYSRKFRGVFGTLGYDRCVDCQSDSAETILEAIADGFTQRDALKADILLAQKQVDQRLDAYTDRIASEMARLV